jgi:ubiquinone/menaquinone biosynthesis C-methylase UbiE
MRRPEFIARQSRCPTGWLGRFIFWIMARETAAENAAAVALLELQPADHVLEVGFGHGRTLLTMAATVSAGQAVGVDVSDDMVRRLAQQEPRLIDSGRLELHCADSRRLPFTDAQFDKVLAVHTLYFWADPLADLREIARVTKPGGRFVLGFHSRDDERAVAAMPASIYRFYNRNEVHALLEQAGFHVIQVIQRSDRLRVIFAVATPMTTT